MTAATDALAHRGRLMAVRAERRVPLPWGSALRDSRIPRVHDFNILRVERDDPELSAHALAATAERLYGDRRFRRAEVWDEALAERLLPELEAEGWQPDLILLMAHEGEPPARDPRVEDLADRAELDPLRVEWLDHDIPDWDKDDELIAQILEGDRLTHAALPWRAFTVRDGDGRPLSMTWVLDRGPVVIVEDVYVTPEHRGTGLGAATVNAAVAAAYEDGARLVYLPTDADGPARRFYRRLGFTELGVVTRFLLRP
jgi:GNAT superfamily N-acetyltransferase